MKTDQSRRVRGGTEIPAGNLSRIVPALRFLSVFLLAWILVPASGAHERQNQRPSMLRGVEFDQKLDERLPLHLEFRDASGEGVVLGEYFREKPVILTLSYYNCSMLCPLVLEGLVRSMKALSFDAGREFDVVTVSFDPRDAPKDAAAKKDEYVRRYGRAGAEEGWHFLTGDEASIDRLAQAVGFRYRYDAETDQFPHAAGIVILTPDGRTARYFYGVEYAPRDLRLALVEASSRRIGSPIDQVLLFCYRYDPATGKYGVVIMNVLRLAGLGTVLVLGGFISVMLRRDRNVRGKV